MTAFVEPGEVRTTSVQNSGLETHRVPSTVKIQVLTVAVAEVQRPPLDWNTDTPVHRQGGELVRRGNREGPIHLHHRAARPDLRRVSEEEDLVRHRQWPAHQLVERDAVGVVPVRDMLIQPRPVGRDAPAVDALAGHDVAVETDLPGAESDAGQ